MTIAWWRAGALALILAGSAGALAAPAPLAEGPNDQADDSLGRRVQELLHNHSDDVFTCVAAEKSSPQGEVLLRLVLDERSQVARADVLKTSVASPTLPACLLGRVRSWDLTSLGASPGDQIVFPLAFTPDAKTAKPDAKSKSSTASSTSAAATDASALSSEPRRVFGPAGSVSQPHFVVRRYELRAGQTMPLPADSVLFVVEGTLRLVAANVDDVVLSTHDAALFSGHSTGTGHAEGEQWTRVLELSRTGANTTGAAITAAEPGAHPGVKTLRAALVARSPIGATAGGPALGASSHYLDEPFSVELVQVNGNVKSDRARAAVDETLYLLAGRMTAHGNGRAQPLFPGDLAHLASGQLVDLGFADALYLQLRWPATPTDPHVLTAAPAAPHKKNP